MQVCFFFVCVDVYIRTFANDLGDLGQVESYQNLKIWFLLLPCLTLSIVRYRSRVSRAIQGKELCLSLFLSVVAIEKEAYESPSTIVCQIKVCVNII